MDWIFYLGLVLLILGALALLGMKLLPVKKNWNFVFIVVGLLIITGLGASLWGGITSLAVSSGDKSPNEAPSVGAYSYSVIATKNDATALLDETARVITIPETYNATAGTASIATASANFTIAVTDAYADMRGVEVTCTTPVFLTENTSKSDSTQYLITSKDTAGQADIRIGDSAGAYQRRTRTFLLGGQATEGQDVTVKVYATVNGAGLAELNLYNSKDITCNVAGQQWAIRVQKTAVTA